MDTYAESGLREREGGRAACDSSADDLDVGSPVEALATKSRTWLVEPVWRGHSAMLSRSHHHPVQPVPFGNQARKLEMGERGRDV